VVTNLPTLEEKGAVHSSQPHDTVAGLEVSELVAPLVQEVTQALQQLAGARLHQDHYILEYNTHNSTGSRFVFKRLPPDPLF
jgi:hypothetical protein